MTLVALLALAGMLIGCGNSKNETPKAALESMAKALADGDSETFVSCFDATEDQVKILKALCDFAGTTAKFQKAMVDAYGDEAGKDDNDSLQKMMDGSWLEKVKIEIDGDKAVATSEGQDKPLNLIKKDGSWKIAADTMTAGAVKGGATPEEASQNIDKAVKMFQAMAEAHKKVMPMIGKDGKTAEDIKKEIGAAMMKAMFGNMPKPMPMPTPTSTSPAG